MAGLRSALGMRSCTCGHLPRALRHLALPPRVGLDKTPMRGASQWRASLRCEACSSLVLLVGLG